MALIRQDEEYSPQSTEPSDSSPISTDPMKMSTIEGWKTPHTTADDNTFYSEGEPRRVFWDVPPNKVFDSSEPRQASINSSPSSTPPPPPREKRKLNMGMSSLQKGEVLQLICEPCSQPLPVGKAQSCSGKNSNTNTFIRTLDYLLLDYF